MSKTKWLKHPYLPEYRVLVCRTLFGWLFKNRAYATREEVKAYYNWCELNKRNPYVS